MHWTKHKTLPFEKIGYCFFKHLGKRPPHKGEFYVSGAVPQAYRAPNDLSTEYHIVEPTHFTTTVKRTYRGKPIKLSF